MKTCMEKQFETRMIEHISHLDVTPEVRAHHFADFHQNSDTYYDALCHILYTVSTQVIEQPIWLTHSGKPYLSAQKEEEEDLFFLKPADIPLFDGDLIKQLNFALSKLTF